MGLLDSYKKILQDYKTKVIDEVKERVLGRKDEETQKNEEEITSNNFFYTYDGKLFQNLKGDGQVLIQKNQKPYKDTLNDDYEVLTFLNENIEHSTFLQIAGLAYGETGYNQDAIEVIPYCILNHHLQLRTSGNPRYGAEWKLKSTSGLLGTIQKMRGYTIQSYASGNPVAKNFYWGNNQIKDEIDYTINKATRNENDLMRKAIIATMKAFRALRDYGGNDISNGSIGWHGIDIIADNDTFWENNLYILPNHRKYSFENFKSIFGNNVENPEKNQNITFISTNVFEGKNGLGATITYKSSPEIFKKSATGGL